MVTRNLIVILGDQLSPDLASLRAGAPGRDVVVMGEIANETRYVRHHKSKLVFMLAAMRRFAGELVDAGWTVDYSRLGGPNAFLNFTQMVEDGVRRHGAARVIVVEPGEHRVRAEIATWPERLGRPVDVLTDDRFVCSIEDFNHWAGNRRALRMEYFYREMRRRTGLLMRGDQPEGGQWNFDALNRKPPKAGLNPPPPRRFAPDALVREVVDLVEATFPDHFGETAGFAFATSRAQALEALDHFIDQALPLFGDYQDAMIRGERYVYHAVISLYLNVGLLGPMDVCARAQAAYRSGAAPLAAVEGFIRQIIGWREYVRGVYWREGPDYTRRNALGARRPLPDFYWTADTRMACVREVVEQTRETAYAHHIQRLMVTGTFALIAGIDPFEVHEWYLAVYADAFEWVEAPNVIGMSQFADGGVLASKPYAASGAYINRMSDYCRGCAYRVAHRTEDDACPFNALYWDFMVRNEPTLRANARIARAYDTWQRMDPSTRTAILARAERVFAALDAGTL